MLPVEVWLRRNPTTYSDLFKNILGRRRTTSGLGLGFRVGGEGREVRGKELGACLEVMGTLLPSSDGPLFPTPASGRPPSGCTPLLEAALPSPPSGDELH